VKRYHRTVAALTTAPSSFRPAGPLDALSALRPYAGPWNRRLAAHLLRRAGFGGSPADVDRLAAMTPHDAVDSLVRFADASRLPDAPAELAMDYAQPGAQRMAAGAQADPNANPDARAKIIMAIGQARRRNAIAMQTWWLNRMIQTPAPLQEKMTLFWHGHFTSALQKGVTGQELVAQNQLYRRYALGNVRDLTLAVSQDPAMLKYLDNNRNDKAHPNENYARELMELFTLGIGNYTEQDVRESARAFTGWTLRRPIMGGGFIVNAAQHDDGVKTFLGRSGNFDGKDIVSIIFQQPAAPKYFARKLLGFFVYEDPEPALVDQVAALITKNDFNLQPVMSTLLRSNVFFSDRAYRALVKSPVEFVVGTHQAFGIGQVELPTLAVLRQMGQVLFYPPSVKGWDGGAQWLNSQTVLTRENFANAVASNPMMMEAPWLAPVTRTMKPQAIAQALVQTLLQGDVSPASSAKLVSFLNGSGVAALADLSGENVDERVRGATYLTMAMPAYQLA
jgi:uncharacterized protein (DUF1800 family)